MVTVELRIRRGYCKVLNTPEDLLTDRGTLLSGPVSCELWMRAIAWDLVVSFGILDNLKLYSA
jgi:hypothetical protein